jgi:hypothetical protein
MARVQRRQARARTWALGDLARRVVAKLCEALMAPVKFRKSSQDVIRVC